jgi:hypothetical protein
VTVFVARLIDLFENVVVDESVTEISEVRASVPVEVGRVKVPVFEILEIVGLVKVLLVRVSVEEVVTTFTPSIATTPADTRVSVVSLA